MAAVPSTAGSIEEPTGPTEIIVPKSVTAEQLHTPATGEEEPSEETPKVVETRPKVTNESRHSIGSYNAPNREKITGASASLGMGGGRSNRPSQSENTLAKSQSEIQVGATNSLSVSQTSKNSLMTFSSSGTFYDHTKKKVDVRIPPKPVQSTNGKDTTDFRQMEQGLLQLLEDFHSGKLEAFAMVSPENITLYDATAPSQIINPHDRSVENIPVLSVPWRGQNCTFEKMENVREQQERLARLHFDLNAQQEIYGQHTDEGLKMAKGNLSKLMENLQKLSLSIEQLQSGSLGTDDEKL